MCATMNGKIVSKAVSHTAGEHHDYDDHGTDQILRCHADDHNPQHQGGISDYFFRNGAGHMCGPGG